MQSIRERREEIERQTLSSYATLAMNSRGREEPEEPDSMRTVFAEDRDRIVHCKAFRRLKDKTQVFLSPEGDYYRTRLTHTLEVAQIARSISRALFLNEDLTEAIALGHDLGHTPFGHAGERALNALIPGGFRHYEQSVRVLTKIERYPRGLNLTRETIDGILNHTTGKWAETLEGRCVRFSDHIAYLNHDIDDAERAGVLKEEDIPSDIRDVLGDSKSARITTLIQDLVMNFNGEFAYTDEVGAMYAKLKDFMYENVYLNTSGAAKKEEHKVTNLISGLYEIYTQHSTRLPPEYREIAEEEGLDRAVADYISGMSDDFAIYCFEDLFIPKGWEVI